jgi:hypothetical protein
MIRFLAVAGSILVLGCGPTEYEIGQTIEMGAFTFRVDGASDRVVQPSSRERSEGIGPKKEITIRLSVLSNESRPRREFRHFLDDYDPDRYRMMIFPHYKLEDIHGHSFDGGLWDKSYMRFAIEDFVGIIPESDESFNAEHLDLREEDFALIIENPDRRDGQPSKISIQLQ